MTFAGSRTCMTLVVMLAGSFGVVMAAHAQEDACGFWWMDGDLDGNCLVNMDDMDALAAVGNLTGAGVPAESGNDKFDLTDDGWINLDDRDRMCLYLAAHKWFVIHGNMDAEGLEPLLLGDADGDGDVDGPGTGCTDGCPGDRPGSHTNHKHLTDFDVWYTHRFTVNDRYTQGDFNCDGVVDGSDFNIWNANKGKIWSGLPQ